MPREFGAPTPWRQLEVRIASLLIRLRPWDFVIFETEQDSNLYVQFVILEDGGLVGECAGPISQADGTRRYGVDQERMALALGWPELRLDGSFAGNYHLEWIPRTPPSSFSYRAQVGRSPRMRVPYSDAFDGAGLATDTMRLVLRAESSELVDVKRGRTPGH